jgi:hypothetical protein
MAFGVGGGGGVNIFYFTGILCDLESAITTSRRRKSFSFSMSSLEIACGSSDNSIYRCALNVRASCRSRSSSSRISFLSMRLSVPTLWAITIPRWWENLLVSSASLIACRSNSGSIRLCFIGKISEIFLADLVFAIARRMRTDRPSWLQFC